MVNIYINLNGRHESFLNKLEKIDIKSLESVDDFKIRKFVFWRRNESLVNLKIIILIPTLQTFFYHDL